MDQQRHKIISDERLLVDNIAVILWSQKWIIIGISILSCLIGLTYILAVRPIYQATVYILPPASSDFEMIKKRINTNNYGSLMPTSMIVRNKVALSNLNDIYGIFLQHLTSQALKQTYFNDMVRSMITVREVAAFSSGWHPGKYVLTVKAYSPSNAFNLVVNYLALANEKSLDEITNILLIRNIHVPLKNINLYRLDGKIEVSTTPISPKKRLILIFSLILGLSLGILVAFGRRLFFTTYIMK